MRCCSDERREGNVMETAEEFAETIGARLAQPCAADDMVEAIGLICERDRAVASSVIDTVERHWRHHAHHGIVRTCRALREAIESGEWKP